MKKEKPAYLAISITTLDGKYYCVVGKCENNNCIYRRGTYEVFVGDFPLNLTNNEAIEEIRYFSRKFDAEYYAKEQNDTAKKEGYYKFD